MSSTPDAASPLDDALRAFAAAAEDAVKKGTPMPPPAIAFEAPRRPEFGDFSTNFAFSLAKTARRPPQDVAADVVSDLARRAPELERTFSRIDALAGFINVRVAPAVWHGVIAGILREGDRFGEVSSNGLRVSLEFGSANPTGPLVVVQGRSLSIGATLANVMRFRGYEVFVEWIINDAGGQLDALGRSIYARYRQLFEPGYPFPVDGYPGEYLVPIAQRIVERDGDRWFFASEAEWLPYFSKFGRDELVAQQQETARRFGVDYDRWQSEAELHETGKVREGVNRLRELGFTYEQDGALFFRATQFGDDKDRVLLRSDGRPTYFCMDVAYHYQKLKSSDRVVDILGPDHHGYIDASRECRQHLAIPGRLEVAIVQQVALVRGNELVGMSKRAGEIVALDEILDEVGVDAARFFFIMPAVESPLSFDLKLAVEKENENPVYYVQYGHARIASVLRRALATGRAGCALRLAYAAGSPLGAGVGTTAGRIPEGRSGRRRAPRAASFGALRARRRGRLSSILHRVQDSRRRARAEARAIGALPGGKKRFGAHAGACGRRRAGFNVIVRRSIALA